MDTPFNNYKPERKVHYMIKITLKIEGMMCPMCESHINDCIRKNLDIKKVKTSHKKGVCEIFSETMIDEDEIKKVINDTGYTLISMKQEEYVKKAVFSFDVKK